LTTASTWLQSEAQASGRGFYQRELVGAKVPYGIVTDTQRRDVSEQLDLLALDETPFVNAIGWGKESGGVVIEWLSEELGPMKLTNLSAIASEWTSFVVTTIDGMTGSDSLYQLKQGSLLYKYTSAKAGLGGHALAVVTSTPAAGGTGVSVYISIISAGHGAAVLSDIGSVAAGDIWYVIGAFANEGSIPNRPMPRQRAILTNCFTILRQDVQITGTMQSTDMYAIGREDRHQMRLRLRELARERDRAAMHSAYLAKTSGLAGLMNGVLGFLGTQSGTHIDTSTTSLTESATNTMVSFVWEYGGRNLTLFGNIDQTAKFTRWDKNRIRTRINDRLGGGRITSYLTESGIEIDLVPVPFMPTNLAYLVDTSKIRLIPKKGRRGIMEKLGKMGDFDDWQILSEFSMEMRSFNLRCHGMFTRLT
jgi:hypothetical protein